VRYELDIFDPAATGTRLAQQIVTAAAEPHINRAMVSSDRTSPHPPPDLLRKNSSGVTGQPHTFPQRLVYKAG
jgi:hypothetical protein